MNLGSTTVTDPVGPSSGTEKAHRGGAYPEVATTIRAAYRGKMTSSMRNTQFGFRCVRTIP